MLSGSALEQLLLQQERDLLAPATRSSRAALEELLSADFVEFGCSGRVFDRESVVTALMAESGSEVIELSDFELRHHASGTALVSYRVEVRAATGELLRASLRSSTWQRTGSRWQLLFHQGTRLAKAEP